MQAKGARKAGQCRVAQSTPKVVMLHHFVKTQKATWTSQHAGAPGVARLGACITARHYRPSALTAATASAPVCAPETSPSKPASAPLKAALLWDSSKFVHQVGVEEVEALYLSLNQRTNEQHVLLVLYAPWCQHCRNIESEVERLAAGLQHEASLSVVALCIDPPAARFFSTEVLGVNALPSFVLFPKGSRTFFKYKGRSHDAQSLLKFLNMVCNQAQDGVWQLDGVTPGVASIAAATTQLQSLHSSVRPSLANNPGVAIALAAAVTLVAMRLFLRASKGDPRDTAPGPEGDTSEGLNTPQRLAQQIDTIMGRMGRLMVRLAGARVSVSLMAAQGAALEQQLSPARMQLSSPGPEVPTTALAAGTAIAAVAALPTAADSAIDDGAGVSALPEHVPVPVPAAGVRATSPPVVATVAVEEARGDTALEASVTSTHASSKTVSAAELLRLLDEEGDVDKVVQKLLARDVKLEDLPVSLRKGRDMASKAP